jgi:hypothetical protein
MIKIVPANTVRHWGLGDQHREIKVACPICQKVNHIGANFVDNCQHYAGASPDGRYVFMERLSTEEKPSTKILWFLFGIAAGLILGHLWCWIVYIRPVTGV